MNRWQLFKRNLHQVVIAIDQLLNTLLSVIIGLCNGTHEGYADETISSYLWRKHHYWYINVIRVLVDIAFMPFMGNGLRLTHCELSYYNEVEHKHSPK